MMSFRILPSLKRLALKRFQHTNVRAIDDRQAQDHMAFIVVEPALLFDGSPSLD
jgi:hypothetical protein